MWRLLNGRCCPYGNMAVFSCFVGCICIDIGMYMYIRGILPFISMYDHLCRFHAHGFCLLKTTMDLDWAGRCVLLIAGLSPLSGFTVSIFSKKIKEIQHVYYAKIPFPLLNLHVHHRCFPSDMNIFNFL